MKKILLLTLISSMFLYSCKDDAVTPDGGDGGTTGGGFTTAQEQKSAGFYFSGNWCGPCGLYGKPALTNMSNKYGNKFAWVASQLNGGSPDPFNCADANSLASSFRVSAVPTIFVGANGAVFQSTSGGTAMESTLDGYIKTQIAGTPTANIGLDYTIEDGAISVTANVEYFEATDKEYSLGVYLIEDLIGDQYVSGTGWVKSTAFHNVLRTKLSANVTGDALPIAAKAKGAIDKMTYGDFLQSSWKPENLRVVAVLWVKGASGVTAVNATVK